MKKDLEKNTALYSEIKQLIEDARSTVAQTVNAGLTMLYWNIGKRINDEILKNKRAGYGKKIIATLSQQLTQEFGKGWNIKTLRHCLHFVETFPDSEIVSTLWRQLVNDYGKDFSAKYLRGMIQFYDPYPDIKIIASLVRQLSWNR